jgi:hypothetical protein
VPRLVVPVRPATSWPAALRLLLDDTACDLWPTVLDGRLEALRVTGVTLQPDGAATVRYTAAVARPDGRETSEVLIATMSARGDVAVWRWPRDPSLPALGWAASRSGVADRLAELGLGSGPVELRLRSYRPGRRGVVQVTTAAEDLFLKVVRPAAQPRMVELHRLLDGVVPAPPLLATTDDGVLVLAGLPGTPMRALLTGDGHGLPTATELERVLDGLPAAAAGVASVGRRRTGDALARVPDHATVLAMVADGLGPRLAALTAVLAAVDPGEHPAVPVHGDFYESQLLVDDGRVVGLLDVDTAGRGHRIDDWATLLAHLALLELILPGPTTVARYRAELERHVLRRWPAEQLRPRVAAVLVGLATGPFRVQQARWPEGTAARIALAEEWAGLGTGA